MFRLEFNGFDAPLKQSIVWDSVIPKMIDSFNEQYKISLSDLDEDDRQTINECIAADQDPGFRTIEELIGLYLGYVSKRKHHIGSTNSRDEDSGYVMSKPNLLQMLNVQNAMQ